MSIATPASVFTQRVSLMAEFKNRLEQLADPSTITLYVDPPNEATISFQFGVDSEVVRDAVGTYHCDVLADDAGDWPYEWKGTGTVETAGDGLFTVSAREVS